MAPSAIETTTTTEHAQETAAAAAPLRLKADTGSYKVLVPTTIDRDAELNGKDGFKAAKYKNYLPTWNPTQKYAPLTPFAHTEHGLNADTTYPDLLPKDIVTTTDLTPTIGTEVSGIQLSALSSAGKDQLARFVAERKVVVFRDQDFADQPIEKALEFGGYFGRHHIHPTSGSPEGFPEVHLVFRGLEDKTSENFFKTRTSSVAWHSDVSYEEQPPGTTFLYILDKPESGGDTLYVNQVEAYKRLSPEFQKRLHGLKALHSGIEQVRASQNSGSIVRREPVMHEHPLVRTHPATGEKALYVNPQFTRSIVGYKQEESDYLLKFLYDHVAYGADFQARIKWTERAVVIWDNRVTSHSALVDWQTGQRRHLARITPQAERPFETPFEE